MAVSARDFAAQLVADITASRPRCIVIPKHGPGEPDVLCGSLAGMVRVECSNGHVQLAPICPQCVETIRGLVCKNCYDIGNGLVHFAITTEVG